MADKYQKYHFLTEQQSDIARSFLKEHKISYTALGKELGVSRQAVSGVILGVSKSVKIAARIELECKHKPGTLIPYVTAKQVGVEVQVEV